MSRGYHQVHRAVVVGVCTGALECGDRGRGPPAAATSPAALEAAVPVGAGAFHDRVRDGTGWVRAALGHGRAPPAPHHLSPCACSAGGKHAGMRCRGGVGWCGDARATGWRLPARGASALARLMDRTPSTMSTGRLKPLPAVDLPPRDPVLFGGSYSLTGWGDSSWGGLPA